MTSPATHPRGVTSRSRGVTSRARGVTSRLVCSAVALAMAALVVQGPAMGGTTPGPTLRTPASTLATALTCTSNLAHAQREPVLLVAGTGATPAEQYSWNYEPALSRLGVPWCAVTVPDHTLGDIQVDAEYLVYAVRHMFAVGHRRIAIVGHSQGGMIPRWSLKFWPDVRADVADMISLAADNHGDAFITNMGICASSCVPAAWQQKPGSAFLRALNYPFETYPGIAYTQIYTAYDELSTPAGNAGTSPLRTGGGMIANIEIQKVCPLDVAEHVMIGSTDPVGFALVMDAITHPGPASAARIPKAVCAEPIIPGLSPAQVARVATALPFLISAASPLNIAGVRKVTAPPPLRSYATQ